MISTELLLPSSSDCFLHTQAFLLSFKGLAYSICVQHLKGKVTAVCLVFVRNQAISISSDLGVRVEVRGGVSVSVSVSALSDSNWVARSRYVWSSR